MLIFVYVRPAYAKASADWPYDKNSFGRSSAVEQVPPKADPPLKGLDIVAETVLMYYVYVLKSDRNSKRYTGSSAKPGSRRLAEHNSGTNTFTRHNRPWRLIHEETFTTKIEALRREKFLKSGQGRKWLDENVRA